MRTDWENDVNWEKIEKGLRQYSTIMEYYRVNNSEQEWSEQGFKDFRRKFNGFYRVRRNEDFQRKYYSFLFGNKSNKLTFESVLAGIKDLTGRTEASFSSKLLHTVNSDMPIWDSEVLKKLGVSVPRYSNENRFIQIVECYSRIEDWYRTVLSSDEEESMIRIFDSKIANTDSISNTKKIDFMLWQKGR